MRKTFETVDEKKEENRIDLTPMLDVVFILLIFFLMTASFVSEDELEVDKTNTAITPEKDPDSILVEIDNDDAIWIDERAVDARALRANIERLEMEKSAGGIIIRADNRSHTRMLVYVMDTARQAGIYDISIAAD